VAAAFSKSMAAPAAYSMSMAAAAYAYRNSFVVCRRAQPLASRWWIQHSVILYVCAKIHLFRVAQKETVLITQLYPFRSTSITIYTVRIFS
jgi:hypothetical protein